jgi:hypothetical protein
MRAEIPVVYNLNAGLEQTAECTILFHLLRKTIIDPNTGIEGFCPPDKNSWEKLYIIQNKQNKVAMVTGDMIPVEKRLKGVSYQEGSMYTSGVMFLSTGSIWICFTHFGDEKILMNIIYDSLIEGGLLKDDLTISKNGYMYKGKKFGGCDFYSRGGYTYECVILNINYDDDLFKSILPEQYYLRITNNGQGISGVLNEIPEFDVPKLYSSIIAKRVNAPEWVEGFDDSKLLGFNEASISEEGINREVLRVKENLNFAKRNAILDKVYPFVNEYITFRENIINLYRTQVELGHETFITKDDYMEKLNELEYMRRYVDEKKEVIYNAKDLTSVNLTMVDKNDFDKFYNYEMYKK